MNIYVKVIARKWLLYAFVLELAIACSQPSRNAVEERDVSYLPSRISTAQDMANEVGLSKVESVVYDFQNKIYYASNGLEYKAGYDGFISKISEAGEILELRWVDSLSRPTGMAIYGKQLFVADVNSLVIIDVQSGEIIEKLREPIKNAGLNDVAISEQGDVYVSESFVHSVFKIRDNELIEWMKDDERLKWANGVVVKDHELLVAGLSLSVIDLGSRELRKIALDSSVNDFDGIALDGKDGYFLTTVGNSALWHYANDGNLSKLADGAAYFGDLEFIPSLKSLLVSRGNVDSEEYYITKYTFEVEE